MQAEARQHEAPLPGTHAALSFTQHTVPFGQGTHAGVAAEAVTVVVLTAAVAVACSTACSVTDAFIGQSGVSFSLQSGGQFCAAAEAMMKMATRTIKTCLMGLLCW